MLYLFESLLQVISMLSGKTSKELDNKSTMLSDKASKELDNKSTTLAGKASKELDDKYTTKYKNYFPINNKLQN